MAGLAWRWLWARPGVAALHVLMLSLGFAAMVSIALVAEQLEHHASRTLAGIDLVIGAKGSPLQLILAGVFHLDVPPGNIPWAGIATVRAQPLVQQVVPVSLGDSVQGYRIVGTEASMLDLYGARLAEGRLWQAPLEAVAGAEAAREAALGLGVTFAGSHGLGEGGESHERTPYRVVGRLAPCQCVLDRLVLTSLESVWALHEEEMALDDDDRRALQAEREVTLLLVRYRSPLAAASLPRWAQAQPEWQAAVPAVEAARLFRLVGIGLDAARGLALGLLLVTALSIFVALTHAARERSADLAMLRLLGAPPARVGAVLVWEAVWLVACGLLAGGLVGHGLVEAAGAWLQTQRSLALTGLWWTAQHALLPVLALGLAAAAVAGPLWRVLRLDPMGLLQSPR